MTVKEVMPELHFEELDCCPACASPRRMPKFVLPDYFHGVPGEFQYVACISCATVYQNPRVVVEDLGHCYPSNYFTHFPASTAASLDPPDIGKWSYYLRGAVRQSADGVPAVGATPSVRFLGTLLASFPPARRWAR